MTARAVLLSDPLAVYSDKCAQIASARSFVISLLRKSAAVLFRFDPKSELADLERVQ